VEFGGLSRRKACEVVAAALGMGVRDVFMADRGYGVRDFAGRVWKVVHDASVNAQGGEPCELVTPPLVYGDLERFQEVVRALRAAGSKVDSSCGVHVHVDKANHDVRSLRNLINIVASKEHLILQACAVEARRSERYCKPVRRELVAAVNGAQRPQNLEQLGELWYSGFGGLDHNRRQHYSGARYFGLNLHNVWFAHTVEFRYFNGTLHAGKLKAYVQFCLAVSAQAITQRSATSVPTVTDNPRYTFRTWLLRLGLIGAEFATCREHLLKALSGDIAFRHGRPQADR
jgi:hypothetical protein